MRRGLITRRNLIRAGIAAPFVLPKYADALSAKQVLTDLGSAGNPNVPTVTVSALGAGTSIPGSSLTAYSNSVFSYWGGASGANIYNSAHIGVQDPAEEEQGFYVQFQTNARQFELLVYTGPGCQCGSYRLWVNGVSQQLFPTTYSTSFTANTPNRLLVKFPTSAPRTIKLLTDGGGFGGVQQLSSFSLASAPHTAGKVLAILGDSWTGGGGGTASGNGNGSGGPACNYQFALADLLGYDPWSLGQPGTGYLNVGGGAWAAYTNATRIAQIAAASPTAILIMGSINDLGQAGEPSSLTTAAASVYSQLATACPGIPIIVLGSQYPTQFSAANYDFLNTAINSAANAAPNVAAIVSQKAFSTGWTVGCDINNPVGSETCGQYITTDNRHMTPVGFYNLAQYLAPLIAPHIP